MTDYRVQFTPARPGNTVAIPEGAICIEWTNHCGRTGIRWLEPTAEITVRTMNDH